MPEKQILIIANDLYLLVRLLSATDGGEEGNGCKGLLGALPEPSGAPPLINNHSVMEDNK